MEKKRIGIIGFGGRMGGLWCLLAKQAPDFECVAVVDVKGEAVFKHMKECGIDTDKVTLYANVDELLDKEDLDGIFIASHCNSHTDYAVKVLNKNIPLYLEKPVAVSFEELKRLREAGKGKEDNVVVSFPLRVTNVVKLMKQKIAEGKIGEPNFMNAWNYPNYGDVYYRDWYRDENIIHGLWLQKATHDFDYMTHILGYEPKMICAMNQKQIFKGDMPENLYCVDCDKFETCMQGPYRRYIEKHELDKIPARGDREAFPFKCQFAKDTGNEDAGSAILKYDTGMIASYSQCFFARNLAGCRGCRVVGYEGTMEFDWKDSVLKFYSHSNPYVETTNTEGYGSHGGGDDFLIDSFVHLVRGQKKTISNLTDGLRSVYMCLKAKESCRTNHFMELNF
ncbi:MAG: Gfo/Idh/MocA family oxidoreductase [Armatimonadetes bacterium]|nr:Gfo/Idh/MocA family oxidoreductase [Candidatus Hippobium faecium]